MDYKSKIEAALKELVGTDVSLEQPKDSSHGDYAYPCFSLAKEKKQAPAQIAQDLAGQFSLEKVEAKAMGPFLNFTIKDQHLLAATVKRILENEVLTSTPSKDVILIECPGPNTNKPLHLGHLRNILLGMSLASSLKAIGKQVKMVNVNNDRGVHICKSMLAYKLYGEGKTPESEGIKSDHFVGDYYVRFAKEVATSEERKAELEAEVQVMLQAWEDNDEEVRRLWKLMNSWAFAGFIETYEKLGLVIDKEYYESNTYEGGRDIIMKGLESGLFYKNEKGAIEVDLEAQKLGKKVLLRSDGTSVYITQDINMAHLRDKDFSFTEMIYVVGNEQKYHFEVLFEIFKKLGWKFGDKCKHFAYGMIELPEGKMKSREGNVVDTDQLIEEVRELALVAVQERYDDLPKQEVEERATAIAMGAIKFFFLKYDPLKNFVYDPKASLSFEGETGPYVQYTHARICSILRKSTAKDASLAHLDTPEDKEIIKLLEEYQRIVERSAHELKPNLVCNYLLSLCQQFNSYYAKHQVIQEDKLVEADRVALLQAVNKVIKSGLELLGIAALERM